MINQDELLGAFIVPTGIGASIGGYAGDASNYARKFTEISKLIVNPNVVNAGGFSGINDKMLYVEGYSLDEFFKGNLYLQESKNNNIGIIFDKSIPKDVLNIHINTLNAVNTVYGTEITEYVITDEDVGVDFFVDKNGFSTGYLKNQQTLKKAAKTLLDRKCKAIAIVCLFKDDDNDISYSNGNGVDPVGGVEAIISHYISKEFLVPAAHSPAFCDYSIKPDIVNPKSASEYITPTFLPCILLGLRNAPILDKLSGISVENLDYLVMPYNALGSIPVFECLKRGIQVYAVKENITVLNVTSDLIHKCGINIVSTYDECLERIKNAF